MEDKGLPGISEMASGRMMVAVSRNISHRVPRDSESFT